MKKKLTYGIRNWKEYNRALVGRGNLTLWFSDDVIQGWYSGRPESRRGRRFTYSDACIELALTLRTLFRFPLRQTQGFLMGLTSLFRMDLKIPHYSCLSRRAGRLIVDLSRVKKEGPLDLVVDSTGLKVYGEGEWKVRTHGKDKRRTWRKYHVAIDPSTHEVVTVELTESNYHDSKAVPDLLKGLENVGKVYGDGAYPTPASLDAIAKAGGFAVIPPRTGTSIVRKNPSPGEEQRNRLIRERRKAGGKKAWKKESGYHRRSLVETHMFRLKTILGGTLHSKKFENQRTEARLMAKVLNRMTNLGMPVSFKK